MRRWLLALVVAAGAHGAQAADLPDLSDLPVLRGAFADGLSKSAVNWQGAYVGGQFGYGSANMDFSSAHQAITSYMLQNLALAQTVAAWTLLGKSSPTSTGFGGFVGYNAQWDDAVLGIEANYNHLLGLTGQSSNYSLPGVAVSDSICEVPPTGDTGQCGVRLSGAASAKITDALTLRGRAGWSVDNFMPYMFGGVALGRAQISRSATVEETDTFYNSVPQAVSRNTTTYTQSQPENIFTYGYTMGLGLEAMLFGNVFARAEYEYIKFMKAKDIGITMNTVRAGVGYKF